MSEEARRTTSTRRLRKHVVNNALVARWKLQLSQQSDEQQALMQSFVEVHTEKFKFYNFLYSHASHLLYFLLIKFGKQENKQEGTSHLKFSQADTVVIFVFIAMA